MKLMALISLTELSQYVIVITSTKLYAHSPSTSSFALSMSHLVLPLPLDLKQMNHENFPLLNNIVLIIFYIILFSFIFA